MGIHTTPDTAAQARDYLPRLGAMFQAIVSTTDKNSQAHELAMNGHELAAYWSNDFNFIRMEPENSTGGEQS
ncbi:MAG: hypothetical protein GKR95_02150 [Gammaproteobacteria bacterium]|nr:hypothetical protein [Gammaproteobacteria bacterium]